MWVCLLGGLGELLVALALELGIQVSGGDVEVGLAVDFVHGHEVDQLVLEVVKFSVLLIMLRHQMLRQALVGLFENLDI